PLVGDFAQHRNGDGTGFIDDDREARGIHVVLEPGLEFRLERRRRFPTDDDVSQDWERQASVGPNASMDRHRFLVEYANIHEVAVLDYVFVVRTLRHGKFGYPN